jgi:amino acid transporter
MYKVHDLVLPDRPPSALRVIFEGLRSLLAPLSPRCPPSWPARAWAGKLVAALAVVSGIGALNGWTLVTTEVSRAAAQDGLFPKAFAWADRKDTAWFGVMTAAFPWKRQGLTG